jgi:uncharacterized small protein (DUF1192 family)
MTPSPDLLSRLKEARRANIPHPPYPGKRLVGFILDEDVAGLSDGLFMLGALLGEVERLTAELDEALEDSARWIVRMAAVREASGIGAKPMLGEIPAALAELKARAETAEREVERLKAALEQRP